MTAFLPRLQRLPLKPWGFACSAWPPLWPWAQPGPSEPVSPMPHSCQAALSPAWDLLFTHLHSVDLRISIVQGPSVTLNSEPLLTTRLSEQCLPGFNQAFLLRLQSAFKVNFSRQLLCLFSGEFPIPNAAFDLKTLFPDNHSPPAPRGAMQLTWKS
jgi:hypothetical protein